MARLLTLTFWSALALWALCWWRYDDLADDLTAGPSLSLEPVQTPTSEFGFDIDQGGVRYHVQPRFEYVLNGLVVSMRHHSRFGLHGLMNDHLNVADLCVVWGRNADVALLREFDFSSGEFTCFFRTRSNSAWARFVPAQLSNNHLLANIDYVREAIDDARIGDQVRVRGYLSEYGNFGGFKRGTSTVRTDTGDGACETIYVKSFELVQPMRTVWRTLYTPAWVAALLAGAGWLIGVMTGRW